MKIQPKISVIIPIHNWDLVNKNILNLLDQKGTRDFHFIFVLDSCSGLVEKKIRRIVTQKKIYSSLVLKNNYGSASAARNAGLKKVKTEWVCFWDSDDSPNLKNFYELYKCSVGKDLNLIVGQMNTIVLLDKLELTITETSTNSNLKLALDLGFTRILFKTELIKNSFFPNLKLGEDVVFLAKAMSKSPKILFTDYLVYTYYNSNWKYKNNDGETVQSLFELYRILNQEMSTVRELEIKVFYNLLTFKLLLGILRRVILRDHKSTLICMKHIQKSFRIMNIYSFAKFLVKFTRNKYFFNDLF
jgi:glycosyltransferase involved in cell wall biosynthesis